VFIFPESGFAALAAIGARLLQSFTQPRKVTSAQKLIWAAGVLRRADSYPRRLRRHRRALASVRREEQVMNIQKLSTDDVLRLMR
jgi:hypothetical protein